MKRALVCVLLVFTLILGGCSWLTKDLAPGTLVDDFDREVTMTEPAQRVVSLAPSSTEIIFALGVGERVVGATEYCNYPEAALKIPRVGAFDTPNLEIIVSLEPDLVLAASLHKETVEQLEALGIPVLALDPGTIEEIYANIELIALALGDKKAGSNLVADMKSRLAAVDKTLEGLQEEDRPLVFYEVWYPGVYTAGEDTFINEMITRAGGKNLAWAVPRWSEIQEEEVLERNPDIILHGYFGEDSSNFAQRQGWDVVKAVQDDNIHYFDQDIANRTGPRVVDAIEEMARMFHPDKF